jgi:acetyl esterase/lipase
MRFTSLALSFGLSSSAPSVQREVVYHVNKTSNIVYAQGVICKPAVPGVPAPMAPTAECPSPTLVDLTLDLYRPIGAEALGPRPGLVALHSGGYMGGDKDGFKSTMAAACEHFASRGFVAITIEYRLDNGATGGGLSPANWSSATSPLPSDWQGGFRPPPKSIYPAVRDSKAAIRWLRSMASEVNLEPNFVAAAGWSAGACTTVHLASSLEWDFTAEMTALDDPTISSIHADTGLSSSVLAGVAWAANPVVTDTKIALDGIPRWQSWNAPLAMYRGDGDTVMTQWAQDAVHGHLQDAGVRCDVFPVPGADHESIFPYGEVSNTPLMDHSYLWLVDSMGLELRTDPGLPTTTTTTLWANCKEPVPVGCRDSCDLVSPCGGCGICNSHSVGKDLVGKDCGSACWGWCSASMVCYNDPDQAVEAIKENWGSNCVMTATGPHEDCKSSCCNAGHACGYCGNCVGLKPDDLVPGDPRNDDPDSGDNLYCRDCDQWCGWCVSSHCYNKTHKTMWKPAREPVQPPACIEDNAEQAVCGDASFYRGDNVIAWPDRQPTCDQVLFHEGGWIYEQDDCGSLTKHCCGSEPAPTPTTLSVV